MSNFRNYSLPIQFNPERFRSMIYSQNSSERIRWWKASLNPNINTVTRKRDNNEPEYNRVEQIGAKHRRVLIRGEHLVRKYFPNGNIAQGDIGITFMPDEMDIGDHDWILPIGQHDTPINTRPLCRTYEHNQIVKRGGESDQALSLTGTASSSGVVVTGTGTTWLTDLRVGDCVTALNSTCVVASVASDTSLTLLAAPTKAWNGHTLHRGRETLNIRFGVLLTDVAGGTYRPNVDVRLDADGATLDWSLASNSPAPGTTFAISVEYLPLYMVKGDIGTVHHHPGSAPLPTSFACSLVNTENLRI